MKLLLDTHVLLWALGANDRLPDDVLNEIRSPDNEVLYSAVSIWEIAIKSSQDRKDFEGHPKVIDDEARDIGLVELPMRAAHAIAVHGLPAIHRDPFDRMLLAQALVEPAWLFTADRQLARYAGPVRLINPR